MLSTNVEHALTGLRKAHLIHLVLTLGLFFANLVLTQMISTDKFIGRLKYVGHEMVFLACGIVLSRIFTVASGDNRTAVLVVFILYMFVWILTLFLTKKVLTNAPIMLTPLIGATLLIGVASVALALTGLAEDWAIQVLAQV